MLFGGCTDSVLLKNIANCFFKQLFQILEACLPASLSIPNLDDDCYNALLQPVSVQEVRNVVFSMNPYKAPGQDGFQPIIYKKYWHIVGSEVCNFVATVFSYGNFPPSLANTLIMHIPKIDSSTS